VLNQHGLRYRTGAAWNKNLVLEVLEDEAVAGRYWWGKRRDGAPRPREEWLSIPVTPIVDAEVYALAQRLRRDRDVHVGAGRAVARPRVLAGLVVCGRCGASCQLETSGKTLDGTRYRYCYYSCRTYCRSGREACLGVRIATEVLDAAVLAHLSDAACSASRVEALREILEAKGIAIEDLAATWRALIAADHDVGHAYAMHLIERVELHEDRAIVVAKPPTAEL
jgi:hypothetical protein